MLLNPLKILVRFECCSKVCCGPSFSTCQTYQFCSSHRYSPTFSSFAPPISCSFGSSVLFLAANVLQIHCSFLSILSGRSIGLFPDPGMPNNSSSPFAFWSYRHQQYLQYFWLLSQISDDFMIFHPLFFQMLFKLDLPSSNLQ